MYDSTISYCGKQLHAPSTISMPTQVIESGLDPTFPHESESWWEENPKWHLGLGQEAREINKSHPVLGSHKNHRRRETQKAVDLATVSPGGQFLEGSLQRCSKGAPFRKDRTRGKLHWGISCDCKGYSKAKIFSRAAISGLSNYRTVWILEDGAQSRMITTDGLHNQTLIPKGQTKISHWGNSGSTTSSSGHLKWHRWNPRWGNWHASLQLQKKTCAPEVMLDRHHVVRVITWGRKWCTTQPSPTQLCQQHPSHW